MQRLWLSGSVLRQELGEILGRPVDLVERQCVEHSNQWRRVKVTSRRPGVIIRTRRGYYDR